MGDLNYDVATKVASAPGKLRSWKDPTETSQMEAEGLYASSVHLSLD